MTEEQKTSVRLTLPHDWREEFRRAAEAAGMSLNEWICRAASDQLSEAAQRRIGEWPDFRAGRSGRRPAKAGK